MRLFLAILLCKLTRAFLRVMKRGGTALPGKVALRVCPDALARMARGVTAVLITGTNGKTTTSRMLEQMAADAGLPYFANRSGSNLRQGITAEFAANATLAGRPKKTFAVIECDEAAFRTVCGEVRPRAAVVTNLFRDQLDRYGEVTHTLDSIREGLRRSPGTEMCLCADCSLTASLAGDLPDNPARFFGMDVPLGCGAPISDAPRCIRCGGSYEYTYHTFAHLGGFRCPKCGYARREPEVAVTAISALGAESSDAVLTADGKEYPVHVSLPGAYNLYNAAAAVTAAGALGIGPAEAAASLSRTESGFGRMERFRLGQSRVTMILVKNPAGCDQAIGYVADRTEDRLCVLCLNDQTADGTDVSWIWDADFERLVKSGARMAVAGTRAEDMRLRLKYAGAPEDGIAVLGSDEAVIDRARQEQDVYLLPTYTAMLPLRARLSRLTGRKEFWE